MEEDILKAIEGESNLPDGDPVSFPLPFQHRDLIRNPDPNKAIKRFRLSNLWNRCHFMDGAVYVHLLHPEYQEDLLVRAFPEPCSNGLMSCRWADGSRRFTENASILNVLLTDGLSVYLVPVRPENVQLDRFTFQTPELGYRLGQRQARRYRCRGVDVELVQSGFRARGQLLDFSALALRVRVRPEEAGSFRWFNPESPAQIQLYRDGSLVFSSSCRLVRQNAEQGLREMVLAPEMVHMNRFPKKKWRNPRIQVVPLPNVSFAHPMMNRPVQLDIRNLSTSGFAVQLSPDEDVLMVGMIFPDLIMNYAGTLKISCKAQVLYRRAEKKTIRYGFVILDMDVLNYDRLCHIVMNVIDPGTHVADEVEVDRLWEFLFESGFIYPRKYDLVHSYRDSMKETYRRLYRYNPEIITQITYQQNGQIYGHASMVLSYHKTWMVHHLAARPLNNKRTGLKVLQQIMHYFNGLYRLPAVGMDYMMFYFRPENRFPDHFFGGFARHFRNPRACSLDLFSYLNSPKPAVSLELPAGWSLEPCREADVEEWGRHYRHLSGGLLLDILPLGEGTEKGESLSLLYARHGLMRRCRSVALRHHGALKALFLVDQSDPGLSLSDFLNSIKVLIHDEAGLPWEILSAAVGQLSGCYEVDKIPLLIYPSSYTDTKGIPTEKHYNLWIIDGHYAREYSEYMMENAKLRWTLVLRFLIKRYLKAR